jgi:hypothetical protein
MPIAAITPEADRQDRTWIFHQELAAGRYVIFFRENGMGVFFSGFLARFQSACLRMPILPVQPNSISIDYCTLSFPGSRVAAINRFEFSV